MLLRTFPQRLCTTLGLLFIGGCCSPLAEELNQPLPHPGQGTGYPTVAPLQRPPTGQVNPSQDRIDISSEGGSSVLQAAYQQPVGTGGSLVPAQLGIPQKEGTGQPVSQLEKMLQIPGVIPGATTPNIQLPDRKTSPEKRDAAINAYFPALPPLPKIDPGQPGPAGRPLNLADLQHIAAENSPVLRQALADVEHARGNAVQVGLPPNPVAGYAGDAANQNASAGMQGGYVGQTVVTVGKLRLAQEAALYDVRNNLEKLRKAEAELQTQVRSNYFAFLVARESLRVTIGVADLTDRLYNVLLQLLRAGVVAPYEVMQLRVVALQTRGNEVQARNRYLAAWRQLAATLSQPGQPLTQVEGQVDRPIPLYQYEDVLARVFARHTDILMARNLVEQAQRQVRLAQLQPIPNVDVRVMVQKDYTTPPFHGITSVGIGMPIPIWNRNQGGIRQAEAQLGWAYQEEQRVRNDLASRLATAFERYANNRRLLELYRQDLLPSQVLAFRGLSERYTKTIDPTRENINYNDLVTTEQNLVNAVQTYLTVLRDQWQATIDIAGLLQTPDLFSSGEEFPVAPLPELDRLGPCPR